MKLEYDGLLSSFAFNFNLRRFNLEALQWARAHGCPWMSDECASTAYKHGHHEAGRCRLTVSTSVLKAHLFSALETIYMIHSFQVLLSNLTCAAKLRWCGGCRSRLR